MTLAARCLDHRQVTEGYYGNLRARRERPIAPRGRAPGTRTIDLLVESRAPRPSLHMTHYARGARGLTCVTEMSDRVGRSSGRCC